MTKSGEAFTVERSLGRGPRRVIEKRPTSRPRDDELDAVGNDIRRFELSPSQSVFEEFDLHGFRERLHHRVVERVIDRTESSVAATEFCPVRTERMRLFVSGQCPGPGTLG